MIASLITRSGLTQEQAARLCGVTLRTIQNWLAGKGQPSQPALAALECAADAVAIETAEPQTLAERIAVLRHIQQTQLHAVCIMEDGLWAAKQELAATNRTLNTLVAERGKAEAAARERPGTSPGTSPSFCAGIKAT